MDYEKLAVILHNNLDTKIRDFSGNLQHIGKNSNPSWWDHSEPSDFIFYNSYRNPLPELPLSHHHQLPWRHPMAELSWSFSSSSCLIEVLTTLVPHPRPPKNITHMQQAASTSVNEHECRLAKSGTGLQSLQLWRQRRRSGLGVGTVPGLRQHCCLSLPPHIAHLPSGAAT